MTVKKGGTSHFSAVFQHSSSQMSVIALINSHSFVSLSSTERSTSCSGCVLEKPFILCLSFAQSKSTISVVTPPSSSSCCVVLQRIHTHTHTRCSASASCRRSVVENIPGPCNSHANNLSSFCLLIRHMLLVSGFLSPLLNISCQWKCIYS